MMGTHPIHCHPIKGLWQRRFKGLTGAALLTGLFVAAAAISFSETAQAQNSRAQNNRQSSAPANARGEQRVANNNARPGAARPTQGATDPADPQQVMAVVNGEQITREELGRECMRRHGKDVLEGMVNKHLISEACLERGVTITEKDVWDEIGRMAGKFGLSTERWLTLLKEERNITSEQYQREIIWPMLAMRRLAAAETDVTEEELKQAFESEYGPKVRARIIVVSSERRAKELLEQVRENPDSFGDVAKDNSEDQASAAARGLIPPIRKHIGDAGLEEAAFSLKAGEISDVISVANQFVIIKCERQEPETYIASQNLPEVEGRLRETIRDQKLRIAASELFRQLQDQAELRNVYNDPELSRQMPGVAATINQRQIRLQELADECIQRHGEEVLDGEVNRKILQQALRKANLTVSDEDLQAEVSRAADAYGYVTVDGSPDVDAWLKHVTSEGGENVTVDLYLSDVVWPSVALKVLVGESIQVSEDDLQKGFESNYGERVEVLAIVLANQRRAQQVWEMARNNPTDSFFGELANQYSIEPVSRANLGKVPPIRKYGGNDLVEKEAFRLKPGELSGIVAVGDKYIMMRCLGRTEPIVVNIDEVRDELEKDLHERKLRVEMARTFDHLKETAKVQTYLAGMVTRGRFQNASSDGATRRPAASVPPPATQQSQPTASPSARTANPRTPSNAAPRR